MDAMDKNKWVANRAGLINFWYYDEEVFDFSDGKLLLRGSNGSGKSVTMQSLIPLLLDGNKSPERLDPFGSKARKLENYLLGDEDSNRDENTGYLFMEFKKLQTENYITIGMGMRAVRGKPLQSWGFSITDGRRIGQDFFLYKNLGDRIPLTRKELENRIAGGGQVCETSGEYMKMVNTLLFGFEEPEEYDELIKLLVQLRTPKLSKDFKPTVIYEIMENSLQPLSEDDLRPMSEAIENMDNIRTRLEELKASRKAADKIQAVYDRYNRFTLLDKAVSLVNCSAEMDRLVREKQELEGKKEASLKAFNEAEEALAGLEIKRRTTDEKRKELEHHDSLRLKERLRELERNLKELAGQLADKEQQLSKKKTAEVKLSAEIRELESAIGKAAAEVEGLLDEMENISGEFCFDEHGFMNTELKRNMQTEYNFSFTKNSLNRLTGELEAAVKALMQVKAKNQQYDEVLKELEGRRQDKTKREKVLEQAAVLLSETREELIEKVYTWRKSLEELTLQEDTLVKVSRAVNGFSPESSYDEVVEPVRKDCILCEGALTREKNRIQSQVERTRERMGQLEAEIREWKNRKDPEPQREDKVVNGRKRLMEAGIPHIPLYRAVDFSAEVPEERRGRLEEALMDMGLLDALVIPEKYRKKAEEIISGEADGLADRYISPSPNFMSFNLSHYLRPDKMEMEGISFEDVDNVLKSILIDKNRTTAYITEKGEYGIGLLEGFTTKQYMPRYIGTAARKRFREEMVLSLEEQRKLLLAEVSGLQEELRRLDARISVLGAEFGRFPDKTDLLTAVNQVSLARFNFDRSVEELLRREGEERKVFSELKELQQRAFALTGKFALKAELELFEEALSAARKYKDHLYELENRHSKLVRSAEMLRKREEDKLELEGDMDNLRYDMTLNKRKTAETEALHKGCMEQLRISGYAQIEKEIDECVKLLTDIPQQVSDETRKSEREKAALARYSEQWEICAAKEGQTGQLLRIWEENFVEDLKLGYVSDREFDGNALAAAKRVAREIPADEKHQRDDFVRMLYERFQENSPYLREYVVKIDTVFENFEPTGDAKLDEALGRRKRLDITAKVRGREVAFRLLLDFISEGVEENEKLLRESDRQLFEDILVKNISKKIRAKIYHSEQWVKKMNRLMEEMNTSSGLSFSLKWSSRKADTEEQLDTRELVELLMQEGTIMTEANLNKLSDHFRSKISEARRIQEDSGKNQTFHVIMREILDYRKWFEFRLFYLRTGQARKELTNNVFYQFSGGEKAMAMYVPLFSAVYARYQGARKDCPRLVSLDEAFAGVDEKNIRDMFRLLTELDLDYIINSQILWGDYDTVPSLAISELIRPDNADFVTVIRYLWNGKVKQLVS